MHPQSLIHLAVLGALSVIGVQAKAQSSTPDGAGTGAQTIPAIVVSASSDASAQGLQAAYPGGQVARGGRVGLFGSQDTMSTPFSITNYTQQLISDQQAASVGDVLQSDPAVRVARGFGNYQQLYMVRGLPIYSDDMAYNGLYGLLPRQYLAAELLERVEVLRGASAFLNGAAPGGSGLGGAINVMPKRAPNAPLNDITLGLDSGSQAYFAADVARRFGPDQDTGIRVNAVRRDGGTAVDDEKRRLSVLSVGADYRSADLRLSADLGYQDHHLGRSQPSITIAAGLPIPTAPDASANLGQPWTYSNERDTFGTLRSEYDLSQQWTVWAAAGLRDGHESAIFANPTVIAADGTTSTYRFDNTRQDNIVTGELGVRAKLRTGEVSHHIVASLAAYQAKSKNAYAFSNFGGFAGNLVAPSDVSAPSANFFTGGTLSAPLLTARTKTSSAAIADVLGFSNDRVLVSLGARYQKIGSDSYDYNSGAPLSSYSKGRVTPVVGLVAKASPALSFYGNYIEGLVQGDTAPDTYTDPATNAVKPVTNRGQVFEPYASKQTELGAKYDAGRFGGTASIFSTAKPIASVNTTSGTYEVTDHQRNRGAELTVYGEAARGLRILGGATWLNADVAGKVAIGAPRSQFNLGLDWDVAGISGLSINGRVVQTASQYADGANTQTVPSWSRVDIGARWALDVGSQLVIVRARIDNLMNRNEWVSAGGYPGAGYLVLGAPRTLALSGTVAF